MNKRILNKALPHIVAIFVFVILSAVYFSPQLGGYLLRQSDITHFLGMSKEINDFREKFNKEPLWTSTSFSGMPAYQISTRNPNFVNTLKDSILKLIPRPIGYMFFLMIGFYILLLCFDVNPWVAIIGSLAFGLSSFNILYLSAGHNSKVHALSFIPPLVGSVIYTYRKNMLTGSALLAIFTCLHVSANHVQMTYYLLYLLLSISIVEFIVHLQNGLLPKFLKATAFLIVSGVIGISPTLSNLATTSQYGKYSTRGKSELTIPENAQSELLKKDALDKDYIKEYSLGFGEIWSLAIPNVKGGSGGYIGNKKEVMSEVPQQYKQTIAQQSAYWGEQKFSGGAFYYGAGIFLLFILGVFFIQDKIKWALLATCVLAVMLSWKYSNITDFFIQNVPLFNKFRDTKMILILVQLAFPLTGFLFIQFIMQNKIDKKKFIYISLSVSGLLLLFYMAPKIWFDFLSRAEDKQISDQLAVYSNNPGAIRQLEGIKDALINARIIIFKKDLIRSLFFLLAIASLIYFFISDKLKQKSFLVILCALVLIDLWAVDKRYLNNEKHRGQYMQWVDAYEYRNPFKAKTADLEILMKERPAILFTQEMVKKELKDIKKRKKLKSTQLKIEEEKIWFRELNLATNYRVFSLQNPFTETRTAFYHKSLGGYHGAKLKKYQELIDFYLYKEYSRLVGFLQNKDENKNPETVLKYSSTLNMLNTKYIIHNPETAPIENPYHYGNAWFINKIKFVKNADEEILAIKDLDKHTAVVQEKYRNLVSSEPQFDSLATITLKSYKPNHLVYKTSVTNEQIAVFSEIYYDAGWNAYIDGNLTDYFQANFLLRAMKVPEGNHTIEFKFEPKAYITGRKISNAGSALLVLFVLGLLFANYRKNENPESNVL